MASTTAQRIEHDPPHRPNKTLRPHACGLLTPYGTTALVYFAVHQAPDHCRTAGIRRGPGTADPCDRVGRRSTRRSPTPHATTAASTASRDTVQTSTAHPERYLIRRRHHTPQP
jgi:hypothetical protein